jgi:hypothetical protein
MIKAGMITKRKGKIGDRILVPATVEPFLPFPPKILLISA